ncbi:hypothetical protein PF005_g22242 [Phytophthora fragariae]|uniref:Uncharacterized protein n=1 Tax=Phytophthora fragariae TaxID=53985 RepID=A0A6A3DUV6_9STRA|nr:hypothetical protein PF003_g1764 [Phytophthora fragariae]KAE8925624.1 hypothetical protein PF009_g24172 [Phytophthora fragariae]KAE8981764.1 hypothetical protein PF011_g21900 [Phytophthora fragariae]KAE9079378.1 hypothetical protein PF010_g22777 [Phytophthora fragariae]KAE9092108.1 hypothetical protein PF007_g18649 [Phytophthora fragariae]
MLWYSFRMCITFLMQVTMDFCLDIHFYRRDLAVDVNECSVAIYDPWQSGDRTNSLPTYSSGS